MLITMASMGTPARVLCPAPDPRGVTHASQPGSGFPLSSIQVRDGGPSQGQLAAPAAESAPNARSSGLWRTGQHRLKQNSGTVSVFARNPYHS